MAQMTQINANVNGSDVICDYNIFYYEQKHWYEIPQMFEAGLQKWHKIKYNRDPKYTDESPDYDTVILKYITQFVNFTVNITPISSEYQHYDYNIKVTLKEMKCLTEFSNDYKELLKLTNQINENIMKVNKELNDMFEEERQELCGIEYAMDHC